MALEWNELKEAFHHIVKGHSKQYQAPCNPAKMSEASLQGHIEIQVNQLVISVHLSIEMLRQARVATLDNGGIGVPHSLFRREGMFPGNLFTSSPCI